MVINNDHSGLTVEVIVNGEALKECNDDEHENDPNTVARYVEVQPGTEFGIRWSVIKE